MKCINSKKNIYINSNGIVFATKKKNLTQNDFESLDKISNMTSIFDNSLIDANKSNAIGYIHTLKSSSNTTELLTDEIIKKALPNNKNEFFYINSKNSYEYLKYNIPEYLQNLGVTIEEVPCFYEKEFDTNNKDEFYFKKITNTENCSGFFNAKDNKVILFYPVFIYEKLPKDFIKKENEAITIYVDLIKDETFYTLLHELRHTYNFRLLQKYSLEKGLAHTDLIEYMILDEISAEFSSICARINNAYLNGYQLSIKADSVLLKDIEKILEINSMENSNNETKIDTISEYIKDFLSVGEEHYNLSLWTMIAQQYLSSFSYKNFKRNQLTEQNFNQLKSKMMTFDLYNPKTQKIEHIDISKSIHIDYDKSVIHNVMRDIYASHRKKSRKSLKKNKISSGLIDQIKEIYKQENLAK